MSTPEDVLRYRNSANLDATRGRAADSAATTAAELSLAQARLMAAINGASLRLEAAGYPGGSLKQYWKGGTATVEIAAWVLPVELSGFYYLVPSQYAVLTTPLDTQESVARHRNNVSAQRENPHRHHAVAQGWLMGLSPAMNAGELNVLSQALDVIAPASS
jgi:hypothetical protein